MQRSGTASATPPWSSRAARTAVAAVVLASGSLAGLPPAYAISPPTIDPAAVPADGTPGPPAPMKQNSYCTEVGVLPGSDFRSPPKYMELLNMAEAWQFGRGAGQKVAVIDTGVTPHPRFQHLIAGGDYVMGGDGLSDCDAHGTLVASMIGAAPANGAVAPPAAPRKPVSIPTTEPPPIVPPPQTVTLSPLPQTITMVPAPPPGADQNGAPGPAVAPDQAGPSPAPAAPGAANHGDGTVTIPSYSGGGHVAGVDHTRGPRPQDPPKPPPPPPPPGPDAYSGIAPEVEIIAIRQSSQAFGLKDPYTGDEDPQTREKIDNVETMARAIVHAANMGATVINISDVSCMSARNIVNQRALGAAVRYAAVDKNAVIVAAAGDTGKKDCKQNPTFDPMQPQDPRDWAGVSTVVTPSWFSDYVLTVGAVDAQGRPLAQAGQAGQGQGSSSVAGPWVGIAAPGDDVIGLSPRDDGLINAIDGPDNTLLVPSGTSFATAIVSGVAALVRAKYPQLSALKVIDRLERTARAPARGVDNQLGHGLVDPVAALTWDVPETPGRSPQQVSTPLNLPKPSPERDMVPVWVASGGLIGALLIAGATFGTTTLMKRSRKQQ
ncbi:MAG: S8 family serine peptidase [Mycobacterium sp.]